MGAVFTQKMRQLFCIFYKIFKIMYKTWNYHIFLVKVYWLQKSFQFGKWENWFGFCGIITKLLETKNLNCIILASCKLARNYLPHGFMLMYSVKSYTEQLARFKHRVLVAANTRVFGKAYFILLEKEIILEWKDK